MSNTWNVTVAAENIMSRVRVLPGERLTYYLLRCGLAAFWSLVSVMTLHAISYAPEGQPMEPPWEERLSSALPIFAIYVLLVFPQRWTQWVVLFWIRFIITAGLAAWLAWEGLRNVLLDTPDARMGLFLIAIAVSMLLGLGWSRRIYRTDRRASHNKLLASFNRWADKPLGSP